VEGNNETVVTLQPEFGDAMPPWQKMLAKLSGMPKVENMQCVLRFQKEQEEINDIENNEQRTHNTTLTDLTSTTVNSTIQASIN